MSEDGPDGMSRIVYYIVRRRVRYGCGRIDAVEQRRHRYIRSRGDRYPDGVGIEPTWAQEVMGDVDLLAFEPDPKSRMGASRFMGHSRSAGRVLVVIAYRDLDGDLHGINAWPATGADIRLYEQGDDDGQDD